MLCDACYYSNACILIKGTISVPNKGTKAVPNKANKNVIFKDCAPFTNCISI